MKEYPSFPYDVTNDGKKVELIRFSSLLLKSSANQQICRGNS